MSLSDIIKLLEQIPIWKRVRELPDKLAALEGRIAALEAERGRRPPGPLCPMCGASMKAEAVRKDPTFGVFGVQLHTLACTACAHREERQVDPSKT